MEETKQKYTKEIIASVVLVLILGIILGLFFFLAVKKEKVKAIVEVETVEEEKKNPFDDIKVEGQSAIVVDFNSQEVYYAKNSNMILPLASLTKLMTVLLAYEILDHNSSIEVGEGRWQIEGEYPIYYPPEKFKVIDLINLVLVASYNDGANALAISAGQKLNQERGETTGSAMNTFVKEMNAMTKKLNMTNTTFYNPSGLDQADGTAGAKGTVNDLEKIFKYMLVNNPEIVEATKDSKYSTYSQQGIVHNLDNTNEIVSNLPNLLVSKTGFTDTAGGNLAVVIDPGLNNPVMIAVLGSSKEGRFSDIKKLSDTLLEYFSSEE